MRNLIDNFYVKKGAINDCNPYIKSVLVLILFIFFKLSLYAQVACNPPLLRPEIDGNPCEWPGLLGNSSFSSGFEHDVFNVSTSMDDQFTQGSSDPDPIANWTWNLGNTNNKTDIANAGSFFKNLGTAANPQNHLYFFGDRTSLNGDANFGFWFFRSAVSPKPLGTNSTSTFINVAGGVAVHTLDTSPNDQVYTGDIFIVSAFEGGGAHPKMKIYNLIASGSSFAFQVVAEIDPGVSTLFGNAAVNTQFYNVPTYTRPEPPPGPEGDEVWSYLQSNGSAGYPSTTKIVKVNGQNVQVSAGAFFEGDLNLTALGITPCFSTFLIATRNSQSLNASLQDFVSGELNITPPPPTVTPDEDCYPNGLTLGASCSGAGSTPTWYTTANGGSPLGASDGVSADGTTLTIPANSAAGTYTYYVSCVGASLSCESGRVQVIGTINPKPTINGLITNDNVSPYDLKVVAGVEVLDNIVDEFNLNTNKDTVVNFTATSSGGTGSTTYTWEELNVSTVDDISFTSNANGTARFEVNSLTSISDFYDFKVTGTDAKNCSNTDTVRIKIRRESPVCEVTGPEPCPGTTVNYKYDPDENGTADPIPDGFNAEWSIVDGAVGSATENTNGATTSGSITGNNVNVVTTKALNCNSKFTVRITLKSISLLTEKSCQKTISVIDNTPPVITHCPADTTIACGRPVAPPNTGGPATATDLCTVIVSYEDSIAENCSKKVITRVWKAVDPCGNASYCTQLITIIDSVAPVITCPANRTGATALTCGSSTLPIATGKASAVDACSNSTVIIYYKDNPSTNTNINCTNIERTWYAEDARGNVSSCIQLIQFAPPAGRTTEVTTARPVQQPISQTETAKGLTIAKNIIPAIKEPSDNGLQVLALPNPFTNYVKFSFSSLVSGRAILEVYNTLGQRLAIVYDGEVKAGVIKHVQYEAKKTNQATLIYKLRVEDKTVNGKLIQLK